MHHFEQKPFDWDLRFSKDDLPDPQNFHINDIEGGQVPIQKVGITKLDIPINLKTRDNGPVVVRGNCSAYASLDDVKQRGLNMSRLGRWIYNKVDNQEPIDLLEFFDVTEDFRREMPSNDAYLKVRFELPLRKQALREEHYGWIYYPVTFEIVNKNGEMKSYLEVVYTYSSACPCSKALAEYSVKELCTPSISHSQRSFAYVKIEFDRNDIVWIEDIVDMCRKAQPSELLPGIVTRVGEFSFAQLMAAEGVTGFVEDVVRRFYSVLNANPKVLDFVVHVCHAEALNANMANAVIYKGIPGGLS